MVAAEEYEVRESRSATPTATLVDMDDEEEAEEIAEEVDQWSSHLNNENGMVYYYNDLTGVSTYTPPPGVPPPAGHTPVKLF